MLIIFIIVIIILWYTREVVELHEGVCRVESWTRPISEESEYIQTFLILRTLQQTNKHKQECTTPTPRSPSPSCPSHNNNYCIIIIINNILVTMHIQSQYRHTHIDSYTESWIYTHSCTHTHMHTVVHMHATYTYTCKLLVVIKCDLPWQSLRICSSLNDWHICLSSWTQSSALAPDNL